MQLLRHLSQIVLLIALLVNFQTLAAGKLREAGSQKSIYVTEWAKLKHQAELGDPEALFVLGNFYLQPPKGSGFRRNPRRAAEYYFQSGLRENPAAQYNVGLMFAQGLGVRKDLIQSYAWFFLASKNSSPVAKHVNNKAQAVVDTLLADFDKKQLSAANQLIQKYQHIISSKRFREARLPD